MLSDKELINEIRIAIDHLEDIAGIDKENWLIIHEISPYSDIDDIYKVIDTKREETITSFTADNLEDLLYNINQMIPSKN